MKNHLFTADLMPHLPQILKEKTTHHHGFLYKSLYKLFFTSSSMKQNKNTRKIKNAPKFIYIK